MIHPHEIAFDIDGVFADTMGLFIRILKKEYGIHDIEYEDITQYRLEGCLNIDPEIISEIIVRILDGEDKKLQAIDGSCRTLTILGNKAPLLFVTARSNPLPIQKWIHRSLPKVTFPIEVIATGDFEAKGDILKRRGIRYFVEDFLEVCHQLPQRGITPLLFCQPWNRVAHPFREVYHWKDIETLIDLDVA